MPWVWPDVGLNGPPDAISTSMTRPSTAEVTSVLENGMALPEAPPTFPTPPDAPSSAYDPAAMLVPADLLTTIGIVPVGGLSSVQMETERPFPVCCFLTVKATPSAVTLVG